MFRNSSAKLRIAAKILMALCCMASVAGAVYLWTAKQDLSWGIGLAILLGGVFLSWVTALTLTAVADAAQAREDGAANGIGTQLSHLDKKLTAALDEIEVLGGRISAQEKPKEKAKDRK